MAAWSYTSVACESRLLSEKFAANYWYDPVRDAQVTPSPRPLVQLAAYQHTDTLADTGKLTKNVNDIRHQHIATWKEPVGCTACFHANPEPIRRFENMDIRRALLVIYLARSGYADIAAALIQVYDPEFRTLLARNAELNSNSVWPWPKEFAEELAIIMRILQQTPRDSFGLENNIPKPRQNYPMMRNTGNNVLL